MNTAAYVIDTDVLSEVLLGDATAIQFFESIQKEPHSRIFISEVSRLELLSYQELTDELAAKLDELVACFDDVIRVDEAVARQAATLRRMQSPPGERCPTCGKRMGGKLRTPDSMIAATALTEQAVLVTRNVKDYQHLVAHIALRIVDPYHVETAES